MIAAGLAVAAALAAGPTPLLDVRHAETVVAVAGSEVIVTRTGAGGRLTVDALPVAGGPRRRLLTAAGLGRRWYADAAVAASGQRVAVQVLYAKPNGNRAGGLQWRLYTGPVAGPLTLAVKTGPKGWLPGTPSVDGDRTLVPEGRFTSTRKRLVLLDGAAAPLVLPWGGSIAEPVVLAGDRVGYAGPNGVFVADLMTGARQLKVKTGPSVNFDVAPDGRVVAESHTGLVAAAPGVPRAAVAGGRDLLLPHFAGARLVAAQSRGAGLLRPVVLDPGATAPRPVGVQSFDFNALDADAQGVAWLGNGCVLYAPVGATAPAAPPPGPCPRVEIVVDPASDAMHGRTVRLAVTCVAAPAGGCHGTVKLRVRGPAGHGRFAVPPGRRKVVPVKLSRRAARLVRRRVHDNDGAVLDLRYTAAGGRPSGSGLEFFVNRVS